MIPRSPCALRIGKTVATLYPILWYGLPVPSTSPKPYSKSKLCGDMSMKGYGYPSDIWSWNNLGQHQMSAIFSLLDDPTDASVQLYVTTYMDHLGVIQPIDYQAIMYRPVDGGGAAIMPQSAFHWANVQLRFGHLVEI